MAEDESVVRCGRGHAFAVGDHRHLNPVGRRLAQHARHFVSRLLSADNRARRFEPLYQTPVTVEYQHREVVALDVYAVFGIRGLLDVVSFGAGGSRCGLLGGYAQVKHILFRLPERRTNGLVIVHARGRDEGEEHRDGSQYV